jgi:hypothetical protein
MLSQSNKTLINKSMFKENKYSQTYYSIIERAKSRVIEGYTERHHIIPKSMGGSDDSSNLVDLTAREHFICHLLLPKMTEGEHYHKMIRAYVIMSGREIYGSRKYAFYREEYSKINSKLRSGKGNGMWGADRAGEKNTFYGKKHSEETKRKISENRKGKNAGVSNNKWLPESRSKIGAATKRRATCYNFVHPEHGEFYGTTGDLAKAYNFSRTSEAYKLVKGEYKSYKGWKMA